MRRRHPVLGPAAFQYQRLPGDPQDSQPCGGHTRCTDARTMEDADYDELLIDVPEAVECDPFEDEVTNEIVLLELMKLDPSDIELL